MSERVERPAVLVSEGEPERLDHRPGEEDAEIGERGEDQPVRQALPPSPSARDASVSSAIVVIGLARSALVSTSPCTVPCARRIGRPARRAVLSKISPGAGALLLEDGLAVLAVEDDPGERVAIDLVEVAALGAEPDRQQRLDGAFGEVCCFATAFASARRPDESLFESRPPTTGKKPSSESVFAWALSPVR